MKTTRPRKIRSKIAQQKWFYMAKVSGICFLGAVLTLGATNFSRGRTGSNEIRNFVHLKAARNPAQLFKTDTWYQAYGDSDATKLSPYGTVLFGNKVEQKVCTLTFDDGPHPLTTPKLVSTLKQLHVPATFFVIGKQVDRFPYLIQTEAQNGFEIGNHSYSHVTLTRLNSHDLITEFAACNLAVRNAGGPEPRFCRPPGGDINWATIRAAESCGLRVALWSDDPGDYAIKNAKAIADGVIKHIRNGSIILLHDGNIATVEALPQIVNWARSHGYRFVPLHDLPSTRI